MILDIIIAVILILFAAYGWKKGFLFSLIHLVGWAVALVCAYFGVSYLREFVKDNTGFFDNLKQSFLQRFSSDDNVNSSISSLPSGLDQSIGDAKNVVADSAANLFANLILTALLFVTLFFAAKFLLWLILRLFSKSYRDGAAGFFDGLFGMVVGLIKGALFVMLLLALLLPLTNMIAPDMGSLITDQLDSSLYTKTLYDNNYLLILAESFA